MSVESSAPSLPAPALPSPMPSLPSLPSLPTLPTLPAPGASLAVPASAAPAPTALPTLPKAQPPTGPKWKPIQRSKARKALNGLIGVGVLAALAAGVWFAYQSLTPTEDTTTPTTLLIDNPDSVFGKANVLVQDINAQAPDQELLDLVGVEAPPTTTP